LSLDPLAWYNGYVKRGKGKSMKFPQTGKIEHTFGEHVFGGWGTVVKCKNAPYRVKLQESPGFPL
jgi:hypothetical protein